MPGALTEIGIAVVLVLLLWGSNIAGGRFAKRVKVRGEDLPQMGVVQGAMLGLLALLLGFSYSGAMTRFSARQDMLVAEANAVGTAWLRADLLAPPARDRLKETLRRYADTRIEVFEHYNTPEGEALIKRLDGIHADAWGQAVAAVNTRPELTVALLPPLNEMADLVSTQKAARERHIPNLILGIIVVCACGSVAAVGFASVFIERRTHLPVLALVMLIAAALWLIIDLDYPRLGLIRVSNQPLVDMRASLTPAKP